MSETKAPAEVYLSRQDAAQKMGIGRSTLDVAIRRGMIRARRIGPRVYVAQSEIDKFFRKDRPAIWPPKRDGKTARTLVAPVVEFREVVNA